MESPRSGERHKLYGRINSDTCEEIDFSYTHQFPKRISIGVTDYKLGLYSHINGPLPGIRKISP